MIPSREMPNNAPASNSGVVVAVRGSVVGIRFDDRLPPIYALLHAGDEGRIVVEVLAQYDERHVCVHARLADAGLPPIGGFTVPNSVEAITPLIGQILVETEAQYSLGEIAKLSLYYNRSTSGAIYEPVRRQLLPLDESWRRELALLSWPTNNLPEVVGGGTVTLRVLIREYLFVSLFRACAESLASENASRLAAMQRADKNIGELLDDLNGIFHRLRQSGIDEELFDVISGFEALEGARK